MKFYPLQFEPIIKDRIWGGTKLQSELGKTLTSATSGESWELSAVKGDVSVVKNGALAGKPLTDLLSEFPEAILGTDVHKKFGTEFPLLFKFIDAHEDLSIQVHPNDELAKKRHDSFGKTEMWYVMQADPGARIIVGFKKKSSAEEYVRHLEDKSLLEILDQIEAQAGDVFFLETGTIHAIGAGILVAEIQQTSDITYRIYDWDRVDANGNSRELHVGLALDAMNYDVVNTKKDYERTTNSANLVVDCPYFTTNFIPLDGSISLHKNGNSFNVYMCTEGEFSIQADGETYTYKKGDTVLVPAALKEFSFDGTASLLEVCVR